MSEQDLAAAVIEQAKNDASIKKDCYTQRSARNFLCGTTKGWRDSLFFWSSIANVDYDYILTESRKLWRPDLLWRS